MHLDMLVPVNFSSQCKIHEKSCFFERCALNMYFRVQKCPLFPRCVQNAFSLCHFQPSLSSQFQLALLIEPRIPCHSAICHSRAPFTHMEHVMFQWTLHNLRRVYLCVWSGGRGGGQILVKLWPTHRLQCSEQWPKPNAVSWSMKLTQAKMWSVLVRFYSIPKSAHMFTHFHVDYTLTKRITNPLPVWYT